MINQKLDFSNIGLGVGDNYDKNIWHLDGYLETREVVFAFLIELKLLFIDFLVVF